MYAIRFDMPYRIYIYRYLKHVAIVFPPPHINHILKEPHTL